MLIPNRHQLRLDAVEAMAEQVDNRHLIDSARATGNWSLLRVLQAMAIDADERRMELNKRNGRHLPL